MKKYFACTYISFLQSLQFRLGAFITVVGNFIYIAIVYNLWKGIYNSAGVEIINGLSFSDTMIYLVLASALNSSLDSFLVWKMSEDIKSGKITLDLLKPLNYFKYKAFLYFGEMSFTFIVTFIPTFVFVYFISKFGFELNWNLIFFFLSIIFSMFLNVTFDFCVGILGFYTKSVWGVNTLKEAVVMLLSGVLIPLNFFPNFVRNIITYLPFQAIYNLPMQQLIDRGLSLSDRFTYIGIQIIWIFLFGMIGNVFWNHSLKKLTVNGG